jgi:hypothetical protein
MRNKRAGSIRGVHEKKAFDEGRASGCDHHSQVSAQRISRYVHGPLLHDLLQKVHYLVCPERARVIEDLCIGICIGLRPKPPLKPRFTVPTARGGVRGRPGPAVPRDARPSKASQHRSDRAHELCAYHYFRIARSLSDCVLLALTKHVHGPHAVGLRELVEIARIMETAHAKARQEQERWSISPRRPKVYPPPVLPLPAMGRGLCQEDSAPARRQQKHGESDSSHALGPARQDQLQRALTSTASRFQLP